MSTDVIIVRHGERLDEVYDPTIVHDLPNFDPPITRAGVLQACAAGHHLAAEHVQQPFERIFVSPCARTLQTASYMVAAGLGGVQLCPVPGLAECAAAVHTNGLQSFNPQLGVPRGSSRQKVPRFLTAEQAARYCAEGAQIEATEARYDEDFVSCVARLAMEAAAHGLARILIVSHREGIRDLGNLAGVRARLKTEYCCIARFRYATATDQWSMLAPPITPTLPVTSAAVTTRKEEDTKEVAAAAPELAPAPLQPPPGPNVQQPKAGRS